MIARTIHAPEIKRKIADQLANFDTSITSLVVKQEFKRRLLKEAQYLLNQLQSKGSLIKVLRHIVDVLPIQQQRKRTICLEMLFVTFENSDDSEHTERAKRYLRTLIRTGLTTFEQGVTTIVMLSGCACASFPVIEKIPYKRYEFGPDNCSKANGCGITEFLQTRIKELKQVLERLSNLPTNQKSNELQSAENFIEQVLTNPTITEQLEPCLKTGDLIIAMESVGVSTFYTLNSKESQHLCRALNQNLIVRPKHPDRDDIVCSSADLEWQSF